jgi:hypothetical protein
MYRKPSLERFGSFRDLTRGGQGVGIGDMSGNFFTAPASSTSVSTTSTSVEPTSTPSTS